MLKLSREEVRELYWDKGMSVKEIAPLTGKSQQTVSAQMKKWGIPQRSRREIDNQMWRIRGKCPRPPKEVLEKLYLVDNLSTHGIAAQFHISQQTALAWCKQYGIPTRNISEANKLRPMKGPDNPWWNGGRYKRDGYVWVLSHGHRLANKKGYVKEHVLVYERSYGVALPEGKVIHHINGIRDDNRPENLMAVTSRVHRLIHARHLHRMAGLEAQCDLLLDKVIYLEVEVELMKGMMDIDRSHIPYQELPSRDAEIATYIDDRFKEAQHGPSDSGDDSDGG